MQPPCYQPDCEKCPFKDSCRNYIRPPVNIPNWLPYWLPYPTYDPFYYPYSGDPLPRYDYTIC